MTEYQINRIVSAFDRIADGFSAGGEIDAFSLIIGGALQILAVIAFYWYADIGLGLVMAAAILINLVAGAVAGAVIPVILKRLSIDPALAGGVVLTTVTDVIGILAFIGLASYVLLSG